jgi:hypothetical protein
MLGNNPLKGVSMPGKSFWTSKTLWINALALGAYVAKHYLGLTAIPAVDPTVLAAVNFILRFVTKQPITF